MRQSLIPIGFGYGDEDAFFLWELVWDSQTRPRPVPSRCHPYLKAILKAQSQG